jgi:hypothetical protein
LRALCISYLLNGLILLRIRAHLMTRAHAHTHTHTRARAHTHTRTHTMLPTPHAITLLPLDQDGKPAVDCYINAPSEYGNQGCGIMGPNGTYGSPLNAGGGGVFAMLWSPDAATGGVSVCVRHHIPQPPSPPCTAAVDIASATTTESHNCHSRFNHNLNYPTSDHHLSCQPIPTPCTLPTTTSHDLPHHNTTYQHHDTIYHRHDTTYHYHDTTYHRHDTTYHHLPQPPPYPPCTTCHHPPPPPPTITHTTTHHQPPPAIATTTAAHNRQPLPSPSATTTISTINNLTNTRANPDVFPGTSGHVTQFFQTLQLGIKPLPYNLTNTRVNPDVFPGISGHVTQSLQTLQLGNQQGQAATGVNQNPTLRSGETARRLTSVT